MKTYIDCMDVIIVVNNNDKNEDIIFESNGINTNNNDDNQLFCKVRSIALKIWLGKKHHDDSKRKKKKTAIYLKPWLESPWQMRYVYFDNDILKEFYDKLDVTYKVEKQKNKNNRSLKANK